MIYNFAGKKVRKNGKVLDKYGLALELREVLGYNRSLCYVIYNNQFSYQELKHRLFTALYTNN